MNAPRARINCDAIIFDMDGTLIHQKIDFQRVRRELRVPPASGILEHIETMASDDAKRAGATLLEIELEASRDAELIPGACETMSGIRAAGLKTALLTRNAEPVMASVLDRFPCLEFDLAWSREKGRLKPEPEGVLRACRELNVNPARAVCVGDFRYDIEAANAAGSVSVLFAPDDRPPFAAEADHVIQALPDLLKLLEHHRETAN